MGMRFDTAEAATRKDFDRASKVPGGRLAYLSRFPEAIQWIQKPSVLEQCVALRIVIKSGYYSEIRFSTVVLELIGELDETVAKHVVCSSLMMIPNLDQYSERNQRIAVSRLPARIESMTNPSEKVMLECVQTFRGSLAFLSKFQVSERVLMRAITTDSSAIGMVDNPSHALMVKAVRKNGDNLRLIKNPPQDIIEMAVRKSGMAIEYVKNPSEELQRLAVSKSAQAITVIDNPLPELQVQAVTKSPNIIRLIKNPCEEAMWVALGKKPKLIKEMKYATPEMHGYAKMVA